jgi:hypothetical protein
MAWLTAALAFVVAMILFSTMVSAATESVHRVFHMRERGLRKSLERLFDDVVWPTLGAGEAPAAARADFLDVLTRNRARRRAGPARSLGHWFAPRSLSSLDTAEFVQRLAETGVGKAIAATGDAQVDAVVDHVVRQFERLGGDARAYFQERARAMSITVAVLVAFALNIDALRLFSSLVAQPDLAARLIRQEDAGRRATPEVPGNTAGVTDAEASGTATDSRPVVDEERRRVETEVTLGLPIGFAYFPWCWDGGVGAECEAQRHATARDWYAGMRVVWVRWLIFTFVSGLLIGLGGPFWFDTFVRLSCLIQPSGGRGEAREATKQPPVAGSPLLTLPEAFRVALGPDVGSPPTDPPRASAPAEADVRSWIPR